MEPLSIVTLLFAATLSAIIMNYYYYSVFKQEDIDQYDNTSYTLFIAHLIGLYLIVTVINFLFINLIIDSPNIYGKKRTEMYPYSDVRQYPSNPGARRPFSMNNIFNSNTRSLFTRPNRYQPINSANSYSSRPGYIIGDPSTTFLNNWE